MSTSGNDITIDQAQEINKARLLEIENNLKYLAFLRKQFADQISELEEEIEKINRHLKVLRTASKVVIDKEKYKTFEDKLAQVEKKYSDAEKFHELIINNGHFVENVLTPDDFRAFRETFDKLRKQYGSMSQQYSGKRGSLQDLLKRFEDEKDPIKKESLQEDYDSAAELFSDNYNEFYRTYTQFIGNNPTVSVYREFSRDEFNEKLQKNNIDLEATTGHKLGNARENVDRAKFMIYIQDFLDDYYAGKVVSAPYFGPLSRYYNKDKKIDNDKFPEFFEVLMGYKLTLLDYENDIKLDEARQILSKDQINKLTPVERSQLQEDLTEEDVSKEELKRPLVSYLSVKEEEEQPQSRIKRALKKVNIERKGLDPYLSKNPLYQQRAKEIHDTLYLKVLGEGKFMSLLDLTKLPEAESMRLDIGGVIKDHVMQKMGELKRTVVGKAAEKIDSSQIGSKIKTKGVKIATSLIDKSRYVQRHRKKAKDRGLGLFGYIIRKIIEKSVGRVVVGVKNVYLTAKNSSMVLNTTNYFKGSSVGQALQKFTTATLNVAKQTYKIPTEFAQNLITKGGIVYRNILAKPAVIAARDVGHVGKIALKKIPRGLIYGAGLSSIALSLGAPAALLTPIFIGGGLVGVGIDTVHDLMHNPATRLNSPPIRWLQARGSSLFKDSVTGKFSKALVDANPALSKQLSIWGNAFGTRGIRLFSALRFGMGPAMIAATIAGLVGVNPLLAAGATLGVFTTGKYFAQRLAGTAFANQLQGIAGMSRFAGLPLTRMIWHLQSATIVGSLMENLFKAIREGRGLDEFARQNFSFKDRDFISKSQIFLNYLGLYGYFSNMAFLSRFMFGRFFESLIKVGANFKLLGAAEFTSLRALSRFLDASLFTKLVNLMKIGLGPAFVTIASSLLSLGILAALGIPIGGLGVALGVTVGGLVGWGIGALAAGALGLTSGGTLLAPGLLLAGAISTVFGTIGGWIGSIFDKSVNNAMKNLLGIISGVSFLFTLIDVLNNKSINVRKLAMLSISLALSLPALGAVVEKASSSQAQADPTLPIETPADSSSYYFDSSQPQNMQVLNNSGYRLNESEVKKIALHVEDTFKDKDMKTSINFVNSSISSIAMDNGEVTINISVIELDPITSIDKLVAQIE